MTRYLNLGTRLGVETVDELSSIDFPTIKDFRTELNRLRYEYRLAGMAVYISLRCDKTWNN